MIRPLTSSGSGWPGIVVSTLKGLCFDKMAVPAVSFCRMKHHARKDMTNNILSLQKWTSTGGESVLSMQE